MFKNLVKNTDYIVLICILILFGIGVVGIYSAGYTTEVNKDEYIKQMIWFSAVAIMMIIVWSLDYKSFDIAGYILYGVNLLLLILVLFMPSLMGASSWFNLGGVLYQPSEFMKIGYIICAAKYMSMFKNTQKGDKKKKAILISALCFLFLIPVGLILMQPDFGTAVVFAVITVFMIFKMGIKYRYIILGIALLIVLIPIVYFFFLNPIQQQRIQVFIDPSLDPLGSGYNAIQSKIAVGSGMIFGTGLLKGAQTQFGYLPIKSTDFIFSVISEELGFVVSASIVIIFVVLILRLIHISKYAKDDFASLMVIGVAGMIFFHFVQNIGMTIGLLPITGVPLPFVSYGGSSLITNGLAIAIALNVSARRSKDTFLD
ncbi:MAG: rod shape-determining protein RodA [Clostridia bacterium]